MNYLQRLLRRLKLSSRPQTSANPIDRQEAPELDFFADIRLSPEIALSHSLPNLIIGVANQLIQLNYDSQTQKYQVQATVELWNRDSYPYLEPRWIQILSDAIIVGTGIDELALRRDSAASGKNIFPNSQQKIIQLSRDFKKVKVRKFIEIAAMAINGEIVFVGTEGKLILLDRDLETLGQVNLELGKKNTHDILVYQSIAYLLDNVIEPTYILRVNVSNPVRPQIISNSHIFGINHHLRKQWLNPELNQWCILQSYGTQAGSGENIILLPLDLKTGGVNLERSQFSGFISPFDRNSSILGYQAINQTSFSEPREFIGIELLAANPLPPLWAVIYEQREQLYLALIESRNYPIIFDKQLYLGKLIDSFDLTAEITPINSLLFLVLKGYKNNHLFARLVVIDVTERPSILLNQNINEVNLSQLACI